MRHRDRSDTDMYPTECDSGSRVWLKPTRVATLHASGVPRLWFVSVRSPTRRRRLESLSIRALVVDIMVQEASGFGAQQGTLGEFAGDGRHRRMRYRAKDQRMLASAERSHALNARRRRGTRTPLELLVPLPPG